MLIKIFTDGACKPNPGHGGWAAIVRRGSDETEISGYVPATTSNRMEITAVIKALETIPEPSRLVVHTDSRYVKNGASSWVKKWKRNGWKTAAGKPVLNIDLWERIDALTSGHTITWVWVRGHSGHRENERCDKLAEHARKSRQMPACHPPKDMLSYGEAEGPDGMTEPSLHDRMSTALDAARKAAGGNAAMARAIGDITSQAISQWKRVPAERVIEVERVTGIPRYDLRPDIFADQNEAAR